MFSKNNHKLPKNEREYFDKPVMFQKEGMVFYPVFKKAYEYSAEGPRVSHHDLINTRNNSMFRTAGPNFFSAKRVSASNE
jgi:hypothetical protein